MYRTIVSAQVLHEHLGDGTWIVCDCRHSLTDPHAGARAYAGGHIPGARFVDFERELAGERTGSNGRHPLPDRARFLAFLASLGANDRTQLVAYDDGGDMFASRFWFVCRWAGYDRVAVLDGGIAAWRAAGFPVETGAAARPSETRGSVETPGPAPVTVSASDVLANLGTSAMTVLDARSGERFRGETEPLDRVAGHIPGARNRWYKENFDASGRFKTPAELREAFAPYGTPERIVHQCGSGVSATVNALAMEIAGLEGWRLYPGSWSEWCSDPSRPVATGPESA